MERETCEYEDCLDDPSLEPHQRHLLAVALKWQLKHHISRLEAQHRETDKALEQLRESLDDHLKEAAPALEIVRKHERTFEQANTVFRLAFCKTWQVAVAVLTAWLVIVEISQHMGWHK